jgi:hypothetical protein
MSRQLSGQDLGSQFGPALDAAYALDPSGYKLFLTYIITKYGDFRNVLTSF